MEIKQIYVQVSHKMFMDDDNPSVASQVRSHPHNQPAMSSKTSTALTKVSTPILSFQLLTNNEKQQLYQSLDDVASLFPEQINYPEVKEALIQKILKNRGDPSTNNHLFTHHQHNLLVLHYLLKSQCQPRLRV